MDTLGTLVLVTKPPTDDVLLRPLVGQKEPLVSLIGGYVEHGHIQEALELANLMQRHGISLNVVTYLCGLKACTSLEGKGSKTRASMKCTGCQGSAMKVFIRQLGPGMIQQMQHGCPDCKGSGETISEKDKCTQCKGEKVVQDKKLEVHVEKGMQHNQKITILGEADEALDTVTGDIVCVLQLKERAKLKRKGDDIFVEHTLNLKEAPCGFLFVIVHLDGRKLLIKPAPGKIVKPGQFKVTDDKGMPMYQRPFIKGKLYIHFSVGFLESGSLSTDQCKALEAILPLKPSSELTNMELGECDKTILQNVNMEKEMKRKQQHQQSQEVQEDQQEAWRSRRTRKSPGGVLRKNDKEECLGKTTLDLRTSNKMTYQVKTRTIQKMSGAHKHLGGEPDMNARRSSFCNSTLALARAVEMLPSSKFQLKSRTLGFLKLRPSDPSESSFNGPDGSIPGSFPGPQSLLGTPCLGIGIVLEVPAVESPSTAIRLTLGLLSLDHCC
ncbi:hypothetical protein L7F22_013908 [Adiantum nelumboides]|nr:hypothetical protein [Adiantum nelumboides]